MSEIIIFSLLAVGVLVTSVLVISFRNPINSALSLIGTFLLMAGIYALLHAPFMAVIQVMVYAGAIMVLFLFVIMLLNLSDEELGESRFNLTKLISALVAVGVMVGFVAGIDTLRVGDDFQVSAEDKGKTVAQVLAGAEGGLGPADVLIDGQEVLDPAQVLEGGEQVSIKATRFKGLARVAESPDGEDALRAANRLTDEAGQPIDVPEVQREATRRRLALWDHFGTIEAVGQRVYTKWLFPFEITALLLLAAIVGAVVMAKRRL